MTGAERHPEDPRTPIWITDAADSPCFFLTVSEAERLICDLERAVICVEAGEDIMPCTCGRMPLIFEPEDGAGVWKVECTPCRNRTSGWSSRPEAVRRWNRMVGMLQEQAVHEGRALE